MKYRLSRTAKQR